MTLLSELPLRPEKNEQIAFLPSMAACALLTALASTSAYADSVVTSASGGFGRIILTLDPVAHGEVSQSAGVLVIAFDRKIEIDPSGIPQGLGAYISSAHIDADGKTLRLALAQETKPHVSVSGDRLALDLVPPSFSGTPPDLPQPAPKNAPLDMSALPSVPVRVGAYPSFTRLVFDWAKRTGYSVSAQPGHLALRFALPAKIDLAAVDRISPPWIKAAGSRTGASGTSQDFEIDPDSAHHIFRDGNKIVVDVLAPRSDAAARPETGAEQVASMDARTPQATLGHAQKLEIAAVAKQLNGPEASNPQQAAPVHKAGISAANTNSPSAVTPDSPGASKKPRIASAIRSAHGAVLTLPAARGAAAFMRGLTAWIVLDGSPAFDTDALQKGLGDFVSSLECAKVGNTTVLRIGLRAAEQISATPHAGALSVAIGSPAKGTAMPIMFAQSGGKSGHTSLEAAVPGATRVLTVTDPLAGDSLIIVPSSPGYMVLQPRNYAEFSVLPSAAGIVVRPSSDDLQVTASQSDVVIARPGGLLLSPPAAPVPGSLVAVTGTEFGPTFIDFEQWDKGPGRTFRDAERALRARAASTEAGQNALAHLNLARFYIANRFAAEALGALQLVRISDVSLEANPQVKIIRAAADYMMGRFEDANYELSDSVFENDRHAAFWRGLTEAALENWPAARTSLNFAQPLLSRYPLDLRTKAQLLLAEAMLRSGDSRGAKNVLDRVPGSLPRPLMLQTELVRAHLLAAIGDGKNALPLLAAVEGSSDERLAAQATFERIETALKFGLETRSAAAGDLEKLRFRWRGDRLELQTLRALGDAYLSEHRWRKALQTLRVASQLYPNEEEGRAAESEIHKVFERLFLDNGAESLPPVQALALFYDFIDLTPVGPNGDEMIRRMAERLVSVDLLEQAAALLKYQMEKRLDGIARAQVATRVAMLYLLDRKPQDALYALRNSRITGLPDDINRQRMLLEARSLAALKQTDRALDVLAADGSQDAQQLRADICWESGRWALAGNAIEGLLSGELGGAGSTALSENQRQLLLRATVAYSLANDPDSLARLREKYSGQMQNSPQSKAFALLTEQTDVRTSAWRDLASKIASIDTFQAFMTDFRKRHPSSPAIN